MQKAIILLSGGLDSTTCLAIARAQKFACYAISFDYSQRHIQELAAAKRIAQEMQVVEHRIVKLDTGQFGGSALTDTNIDVPNYQASTQIPVTYVPARNTVFLSIALGWAEVIGAMNIFIGVNAVDYSGYPDCRPEFIQAFEEMARLATKTGINGQPIKIQTPLMYWSKQQIIQAGIDLGVDYSQTFSCYRLNAQGQACGCCDSCVLRRQGFLDAGIADPTIYT